MKKVKRISNKYIGLIPTYLKSLSYDEYQAKYSARRLSFEIYNRQMLYREIKEFKKFCRHPETYNRALFPGITLSILFSKYEQNLPDGRLELTTIEQIEIEKNHYDNKLQELSKNSTKPIPTEDSQFINQISWDNRPYIRPIFNTDQRLQKRYDLSYNEFRKLLVSKSNNYSFSTNLNFSDNAIIEEFKQHLKFLRQITRRKSIFNKPKEFIKKIKQYKIIQLMDLILWAKLNNYTLEKNMLDQLLYRNGSFENDRLTDTILPLSKSLLDSKSTDSEYLIYLADQEFQQKVGKVIT